MLGKILYSKTNYSGKHSGIIKRIEILKLISKEEILISLSHSQ